MYFPQFVQFLIQNLLLKIHRHRYLIFLFPLKESQKFSLTEFSWKKASSHNHLPRFHNRLKHRPLNPVQKETRPGHRFVLLSICKIGIRRHRVNLHPILPDQTCDWLQEAARLYKCTHGKRDNFLFVKRCRPYDLILNHLQVQELYK